MTRPIVRIYFGSNIDDFEDREMNDDEFAQYQLDQAEYEKEKIAMEAKTQAKAELLERLGITADEAKLLLG